MTSDTGKKKPVLFFAERVTQEPLDFVGLSNNIQPCKYPLSLPLPPPRQQRRAAPRSARSLFRRRPTANSSERASAGAAGTTAITTAGLHEGKGYPQELTQPDTCS